MTESIYEIIDEIIETSHQITLYMIDIANAEMAGRKITLEQIENNEIIKILFERLQKNYRKIQDYILDDTGEIETEYDDKIQMKVGTEELNRKRIKSMTISDLEAYLEAVYIDLHYIPLKDGLKSESIYKGKEFEQLRKTEYNLQMCSLEDIDVRTMFKEEISKITFPEKAYILQDMTMKKFYKEYAINQIKQYIIDLENKKSMMNPKEYEDRRKKLYEQKYIIYYSYLNNKYNGILQENDKGKLDCAKKMIDDDMSEIALGMSKFEIDENIRINMLENKEILKQNVKKYCFNGKNNKKEEKYIEK